MTNLRVLPPSKNEPLLKQANIVEANFLLKYFLKRILNSIGIAYF